MTCARGATLVACGLSMTFVPTGGDQCAGSPSAEERTWQAHVRMVRVVEVERVWKAIRERLTLDPIASSEGELRDARNLDPVDRHRWVVVVGMNVNPRVRLQDLLERSDANTKNGSEKSASSSVDDA